MWCSEWLCTCTAFSHCRFGSNWAFQWLSQQLPGTLPGRSSYLALLHSFHPKYGCLAENGSKLGSESSSWRSRSQTYTKVTNLSQVIRTTCQSKDLESQEGVIVRGPLSLWQEVGLEVCPSEGQAGPSLSISTQACSRKLWLRSHHRQRLEPFTPTTASPPTLLCPHHHIPVLLLWLFLLLQKHQPPSWPFLFHPPRWRGTWRTVAVYLLGDTDATEAQFSACTLQTASSCCTSKPKVSISTFLTHLMLCSSRAPQRPLYTSSPCYHNTKLNPGLLCRGAEGSFIHGAVSVGVVCHTAASPTPRGFPFCPFTSLSPSEA